MNNCGRWRHSQCSEGLISKYHLIVEASKYIPVYTERTGSAKPPIGDRHSSPVLIWSSVLGRILTNQLKYLRFRCLTTNGEVTIPAGFGHGPQRSIKWGGKKVSGEPSVSLVVHKNKKLSLFIWWWKLQKSPSKFSLKGNSKSEALKLSVSKLNHLFKGLAALLPSLN